MIVIFAAGDVWRGAWRRSLAANPCTAVALAAAAGPEVSYTLGGVVTNTCWKAAGTPALHVVLAWTRHFYAAGPAGDAAAAAELLGAVLDLAALPVLRRAVLYRITRANQGIHSIQCETPPLQARRTQRRRRSCWGQCWTWSTEPCNPTWTASGPSSGPPPPT